MLCFVFQEMKIRALGAGRGFLKGVEFSRGADGKVDGLYVSNFRARRQWLKKLD
ncbi:MAG: hypothetical protein AB8H12_02955 [Lewinella sp.]